jgi:two-component system, LytTR family, sensor kinase
MRAGTRRVLAILGLVAFAVGLAFVESVQDHLAREGLRGRDPFGFRLVHMLPPWLIVAALVPAIGAFVRRRPLAFRWWAFLSHGFAAALFAVVHMTLLAAFDSFRAGARPMATTLRGLLGFHFVFDVLLYFAIAGAVQAILSARALRKREADALKLQASLAEARLAALRSQLNPHFLFNVLNTAAMLAREGKNDDTVAVLARLSELLRYVLREGRSGTATLGDELQFLRGYLELEQVRFADRLQVRFDTDPGLEPVRLPSLLLQPLVENAVRHGIARRPGAGRIEIRVRRDGSKIRLEVCDDGPGLAPGAAEKGIGVRTTRERLLHRYGAEAALVLGAAPDGGTSAVVTLPWEAPA